MNIQQQSETYIKRLTERKRNPVKPATLLAYNCYLRNWILPRIGQIELKRVENGVMRKLVSEMAQAGKSASMIAGVQNCIKGILGSAVDEDGNELYPRKWNTEFIDAPQIDTGGQKAPIITALELNRAILKADMTLRPLIILLASSGLRISEALALKSYKCQDSSFYDQPRHLLVIKKSLYQGKEQSTKTSAGIREVDLSPELKDTIPQISQGFMFSNSKNAPSVSTSTRLRDGLKKSSVPGFHSLRRFRITHLRKAGVPEGLVKFWAGHAGKDITDRYDKISQDIDARKYWAEKAGLGFTI